MSNRKCVKCGSDDQSCAWHKDEYSCPYHAASRPRYEHLHYCCRVCGYDWTGPCRDQEIPKNALTPEDKQGQDMTLAQAKKLYVDAGGPSDHQDSEWAEIHKEMEAIVSAKSDRAAGRIIDWWQCWEPRYTATGFAKRVRQAWNKQQGQQ